MRVWPRERWAGTAPQGLEDDADELQALEDDEEAADGEDSPSRPNQATSPAKPGQATPGRGTPRRTGGSLPRGGGRASPGTPVQATRRKPDQATGATVEDVEQVLAGLGLADPTPQDGLSGGWPSVVANPIT